MKNFTTELSYRQLEQPESIQQLRADYLRTLVAPMDGMWETAVIARASFWEIQHQGRHTGHFCLDPDNVLLRFHLVKDYQAQAQEIVRRVIATHTIQQTIASTIEPLYFSLCLDLQSAITPHSYLFRDNTHVEQAARLNTSIFRKAELRELEEITRFYHANIEGPGAWIEPFLHAHITHEELYILYDEGEKRGDEQTLVATGECIPSEMQPRYADLGMVVARAYRGRGLGSFVLTQLKKQCYAAGRQPICSCAAENRASKKAIENAGFISEHRIVKMHFPEGTQL